MHARSCIHFLWFTNTPEPPRPLKRPKNFILFFEFFFLTLTFLDYFLESIWAMVTSPVQGPVGGWRSKEVRACAVLCYAPREAPVPVDVHPGHLTIATVCRAIAPRFTPHSVNLRISDSHRTRPAKYIRHRACATGVPRVRLSCLLSCCLFRILVFCVFTVGVFDIG